MLPRRVLPARPLLAVPPSPPRTTSPPHPSTTPPPPRTPPRRSLLYRSVVFLPLLLIYALLGFAGYAVLISLCLQYLLLFRQQVVKPLLIALVFTCLWAGAGGSVGMAWWRGGGAVPIRRDEEEGPLGASGRDGGKDGVEGEEEAEGLLAGEGGEGRAGGRERRGGRQGRLQVKHDGTERFCRKCNVPKPDRAHHCSSCRRCVLKMDHHCPWLGGGCVGWANYKFFLLFLLYTGALGIFTGAVLFHELVNFVDDVDNGFELAPISWALAALLGVIFGAAVGLFGLYHVYLACKNRSTIEAMESPSPLRLAPISSSPSSSHLPPLAASAAAHSLPRPRPHTELSYKHRRKLASAARQMNIYDLGWRENLRMVFGEDRQRGRGKKGREERWWMWIMPWGWPPGDGHSFRIDTAKLAKLRQVTEEIYAEAAGVGSSFSGSASEGSEQGRREGGFAIGEEEESGSEESGDNGPVRRS